MKWLFAPPSPEDLVRLLRAWRFWLLGAVAGALLGAAIYYVAPPPYRARATVNVDFNLEEAWPQEADRQQFYYLEREARKLEEIAWSDSVMQAVASKAEGMTVNHLRDDILQLSQPSEGGWHFYADHYDRKQATTLASAWAQAFAGRAQEEISAQSGLNSFIQVEVTQAANLPTRRSVVMSTYMLAGTAGFLALSALTVLFLHQPKAVSSIEKPSKKNRRKK